MAKLHSPQEMEIKRVHPAKLDITVRQKGPMYLQCRQTTTCDQLTSDAKIPLGEIFVIVEHNFFTGKRGFHYS
jgi:hypothetical protein